MNRASAYRLLTETLAQLRGEPWDDLGRRVGARTESRVRQDDEELLLFVAVERVSAHALRLDVAVGSPSTWHTQRIEESLVVQRPAPST